MNEHSLFLLCRKWGRYPPTTPKTLFNQEEIEMALFGEGKVGKGDVRELCNEVDDIAVEIRMIAQSEVDRITDRIDSELESSGDKLVTTEDTLGQVKPLVDRLVQQVGQSAPDHVQVLVGSICTEIMSKVTSAVRNVNGVQKNIVDVDKYTNEIDELTDKISDYCKKLDDITDKYQK
jgi:uncharacterized protein Yka (UPF0111/DUF47 family)